MKRNHLKSFLKIRMNNINDIKKFDISVIFPEFSVYFIWNYYVIVKEAVFV